METTVLGGVEVTRFILGSNPFSGFSHRSPETDSAMIHYYTTARIKQTLHEAERLGINTVITRGDHHMIRILLEYWDQGGKLQWVCQTCPELGPPEKTVQRAVSFGAQGCYIHGGHMAVALDQNAYDEIQAVLDRIRNAGLACGIAGHEIEVFQRAEAELDADFYMCCHYDPSPRRKRAEYVPGTPEQYREEDRQAMVAYARQLARPVIHYKVLAAGRNDPAEAFAFTARHMRDDDAVCVGVFSRDKPNMLEEDVRLFEEALTREGERST